MEVLMMIRRDVALITCCWAIGAFGCGRPSQPSNQSRVDKARARELRHQVDSAELFQTEIEVEERVKKEHEEAFVDSVVDAILPIPEREPAQKEAAQGPHVPPVTLEVAPSTLGGFLEDKGRESEQRQAQENVKKQRKDERKRIIELLKKTKDEGISRVGKDTYTEHGTLGHYLYVLWSRADEPAQSRLFDVYRRNSRRFDLLGDLDLSHVTTTSDRVTRATDAALNRIDPPWHKRSLETPQRSPSRTLPRMLPGTPRPRLALPTDDRSQSGNDAEPEKPNALR